MIIVTLERCRSEKRFGFVYCVVAIFFYTLGYFIEMSSGSMEGCIIAIKIMYAGGCFMSPLFFFFVADYCEIRIPKKYYQIPIMIIPVLFYAVAFTFDHHKLLYSSYSYDPMNPILGMTIEPGSLYLIGTFYPLFCIILSCIVLTRSIIKQSRGRRFGLILLLISALAPLIANFSYVALSFFFKTAVAGINFTAFVMILSNFIFFYNVVRSDMFDLAPRAHSITLDLIRDAFIVLDWSMAYTGANKNAHMLFPGLKDHQKGSSILSLEYWPLEITNFMEKVESGEYVMRKYDVSTKRRELEFTLPHKPGKIYSSWQNRITSEAGATQGWIILIQDITETVTLIRNIEEAHSKLQYFNNNLRRAFSTYLSEDVVEEIVSDPTRLQLGGINRHMTALFTDVKNFARIAEALKPEQLIDLLNYYLSTMSDIILDQKGTIDKYQGDAIISFFGAPLELEDHALRACLAAIFMKRAENEANRYIHEKKISPTPLLTRIGINTGEMIVGNMGTQKKMNYTIISNAVNLAARLEGVNKQYGTWILASEETVKETGDSLLTRRLDRIRVVGIQEPIRIYEILETKADASAGLQKLAELFNEAFLLFESRKWTEAEVIFKRILHQFPKDGPAQLFLNRCLQFQHHPPVPNWDGVFKLTAK
jgi:class 3 adenylate cyclase